MKLLLELSSRRYWAGRHKDRRGRRQLTYSRHSCVELGETNIHVIVGSSLASQDLPVVHHVRAVDHKLQNVAEEENDDNDEKSDDSSLWSFGHGGQSLEWDDEEGTLSNLRLFPADKSVDAEVGVEEDGEGQEQLEHGLHDGVVDQLVVEGEVRAHLRKHLPVRWDRKTISDLPWRPPSCRRPCR